MGSCIWTSRHKNQGIDIWSRLNTLVDLEAGKILSKISRHSMNQKGIRHEPGPIYCNGKKISSSLGHRIEQISYQQSLYKYWIKNGLDQRNTSYVRYGKFEKSNIN